MKMLRAAMFAAVSLLSVSSASAADIVDTAVANGSFKTLVAAVQAAGLVDTLKGPGPFTVFAPTDAAFAALPAGTVEDLLKPENKDKLTAVLTYHVVAGKVMSTDLTDGLKAKTVQGSEVTFDLDGGVKVNDASVVTADVAADNGVIHVIDKVILPPDVTRPRWLSQVPVNELLWRRGAGCAVTFCRNLQITAAHFKKAVPTDFHPTSPGFSSD